MPTVSMTRQDMDAVSLRFFKDRSGCLGSREFEHRMNTVFMSKYYCTAMSLCGFLWLQQCLGGWYM